MLVSHTPASLPLQKNRGNAPGRSLLLLAALALAGPVQALDFTNFTPAANNLFSTWDPDNDNVVRNTDSSFVGLGYDWSGVAWNAANTVPGHSQRAFLSPRHIAAAFHASGLFASTSLATASGDLINFPSSAGTSVDTNQSIDLSVALLSQHIAPGAGITTYAVLDPSTVAAYAGQSILVVGHGDSDPANSPRVAQSVIESASSVITIPRTGSNSVIFQGGDSGGPTFLPWTDPTGAQQLTVIGTHYGYNTPTPNYDNFLGTDAAINAMNTIMVSEGFAVRLVGNTATAWTGSNSAAFSDGSNWSTGTPLATNYVAFNAASAASKTLDFGGTTRSMRGLSFGPGALGEGFTFNTGTLDLGRGGLANYSAATQTFGSGLAIRLTDHQYWDAIIGDLSIAGAVNLNGELLVVQGAGDTSIVGAVSDSTGTGPGLSKYGTGKLTLESAATYAGTTWIYGGSLSLGAAGSLPSATKLVIANNDTARLELNGRAQTVASLISDAGIVAGTGAIDLGTGGRLGIDQATGVAVYSGIITGGTSGTTALQLLAPTAANEYLGLAGPSDFAGRTLIDRGNVYVQHVDALGASGTGNETHVNFTDDIKPSVRFQAIGTMDEAIVLRNVSGTSAGTIASTTTFTSADLTLSAPLILSRAITQASRASSWTLGTLNSNGVVAGIHFGNITGALEAGATAGTNTLIFNLFKDSSFYLDGTISQGTLGSALAVTYRGDGTITISGTNSYTGTSLVQGKNTIVNVNSLSGQNGAFGNAATSVTV
ncbi:MAG: beta strand repeat-containing protein, partial [Terrimicrobiaceae bacterium]